MSTKSRIDIIEIWVFQFLIVYLILYCIIVQIAHIRYKFLDIL